MILLRLGRLIKTEPTKIREFEMGSVAPFSSIQTVLKNAGKPSGCLLDTNFIIAALYEPHRFNEAVVALFDILADFKIPLYVSLSTRSEFIDIQRRIIITEALMGMAAEQSKWRISVAVLKELRNHKRWINTQAEKNEMPILSDARIKACKQIFLPRNVSGQSGWLEICRQFLSPLLSTWDDAVARMGIHYIGARETEDEALFVSRLHWEAMYELSAKTCLSSMDAMILNVFNSSVFSILVTTDYDLAYAILAEKNLKTVMVPDSLYERKIKGLRFPVTDH